MDYQLDLTAYRCPLPLLMTKKALKGLEQGDKLYLLLNEYVGLNDFQLLAEENGFALVIEHQPRQFHLSWIKK